MVDALPIEQPLAAQQSIDSKEVFIGLGVHPYYVTHRSKSKKVKLFDAWFTFVAK